MSCSLLGRLLLQPLGNLSYVKLMSHFGLALVEGTDVQLRQRLLIAFIKLTDVGTRNFFLSPQSQLRNFKDELPQSQFRNLFKNCCSATATPQLGNRNFFLSPQLESSTVLYNFRQIFGVE